jgi:signal transduction histidine kinase
VFTATVLGVVLITWGLLSGPDLAGRFTRDLATTGITVLAFGVAGAILIDRRPDLPFGWLLSVVAILQVVAAASWLAALAAIERGSTSGMVAWGLAASALLFLPVAVQGLILVRFPTGRITSRTGRALEVAIAGGTALVLLGAFFGPENLATMTAEVGVDLEHPLTAGTTLGAVASSLVTAAPIVILLGLVAGLSVVVRFLRSDGIERQQLKWMASWVVVSLVLFPLAIASLIDAADLFVNPLFVTTLAIPVLRYRLWSIDVILRRSAVYGLVTGVLALLYLVVIVAGSELISERVSASVAAVLVAVAFAPLRYRVQRVVDRLIYGDRNDPYQAISELDRRLAEVAAPGQMLTVLVQTIAESLRLPYVAVRRANGAILAEHGGAGGVEESWPLLFEGVVEGELAACPRRGEEQFDDRDRRLLEDLALHTGTAVHAEALTADLIESRHRLVTTREEERRRLRRDLHDGLGPLLTAVGLNIDAATARLEPGAGGPHEVLAHARAATDQALADIRRIVYGLRPPALDNLGLVGAIRLHVDRLGSEQLRIEVDAPELPPLPAAVEVAAYRTVVEAVTNSLRHGGGNSCRVTIATRERDLVMDITNDGPSAAEWTPGVGLTSIQEQVEELGGSVVAGPNGDSGGRLTARLPLPAVRA